MKSATAALLALVLLVASAHGAPEIARVNVHGQTLACCRVGSRHDPDAIGGYAGSSNFPRSVEGLVFGREGELALVALPEEETVPFEGRYLGMPLLLVNRTGEELSYPALDSTLFLVLEGLDQEGRWRPVESTPETICGNSFHRVFLPAGQYWEIVVPVYEGSFRTMLRYHLREGDVVSNVFEGTVNPEQFDPRTRGRTIAWSDVEGRFPAAPTQREPAASAPPR